MTREFSTFNLITDAELPIDLNNFYKHDIIIVDNTNPLNTVRIYKKELSLAIAQGLIYGTENGVKESIQIILENRLYWIKKIQEICNIN